MSSSMRHVLFQAIVGTGVGAAACESVHSRGSEGTDSSRGDAALKGLDAAFASTADAAALDDAGCPANAPFVCLAYATLCTCVGSIAATDCTSPAQHHCYDIASGAKCWCDPSSPSAPFDCAQTWYFQCASYEPRPEGCRCDPSAPRTVTDCPSCNTLECYSFDPPIGCRCLVCIV